MTHLSLTGLDWQLLELLQQNARISISDLATQLNRSRSNISEHLKKLQSTEALKKLTTHVDEEKLGFGICAFVRLQADSSRHRQIVNTVIEVPEVAECHVLTGAELLIIRVVAKDMPHLRKIVDGFTRHGATQTDIVFSTVKSQLKLDQSLRKQLST